MFDLTRREFVSTCIAAGAVSPVSAAGAGAVYVYASESGHGSSDPPLVLGFLVATHPEKHIRSIQQIKKEVGCRRRWLHYRGTDRAKISAAKELMHYFVRDPDLRFIADIWQSSALVKGRSAGSEPLRVKQYVDLYRRASLPQDSILRLKNRKVHWDDPKPGQPRRPPFVHRPDHSGEVPLRIRALVQQKLITRGESVPRSAQDGLVELSCLLTGCVSHDSFDLRLKSESANDKIALRLRTLMKAASLAETVSAKWTVLETLEENQAGPGVGNR